MGKNVVVYGLPALLHCCFVHKRTDVLREKGVSFDNVLENPLGDMFVFALIIVLSLAGCTVFGGVKFWMY